MRTWIDREKEGDGSYVLHIVIFAVVFLTTCWPALIWHGTSANGGWRWDGKSTIACLIWWGVLLVPVAVITIRQSAPARRHEAELRGQWE